MNAIQIVVVYMCISAYIENLRTLDSLELCIKLRFLMRVSLFTNDKAKILTGIGETKIFLPIFGIHIKLK